MKFLPTAELPEVLIIEPDVYRDPRGFFLETYHAEKFHDAHGQRLTFVQDNHSRSGRGTLRGLHAQLAHPQGKLVRVVNGEILDVAVDIRRGSPTFRRWMSVVLSAENFRQCYIPPGFAHGFCVTSACAEVEYKCTDYYDPASELRLRWDDPSLEISWPVQSPVLSDKDRTAKLLSELQEVLPLYTEPGR